MAYVSMEELLKNKSDSVYKTVILAFRRALELGSGSEKLVDAPPNAKLTSIALAEMMQNKISYKIRKK